MLDGTKKEVGRANVILHHSCIFKSQKEVIIAQVLWKRKVFHLIQTLVISYVFLQTEKMIITWTFGDKNETCQEHNRTAYCRKGSILLGLVFWGEDLAS